MGLRVTHTLDDLEADMRTIAREAPRKLTGAVRDTATVGNRAAKTHARATSGTHARDYPGTFTAEANRAGFTGIASYEYGPEHRGQGMLAGILEEGSQNNPAHHNLAKSVDLAGPLLAYQVRRTAGDQWWPR